MQKFKFMNKKPLLIMNAILNVLFDLIQKTYVNLDIWRKINEKKKTNIASQ